MKRVMWLLLALVAVLALTFTFALAQETDDTVAPAAQPAPQTLPQPDVRPGFVD